MTRLPRTIRLDPSDAVVFPRAAAPGEWAVPGGFCFWGDDPTALEGRRRQAFRAGFLGLGSFGWSTLVEVVEVSAAQREAAIAALAAHLRGAYGAPDDATARAAAEEEIAFAETLCEHPPGTLVALARSVEGGDVRERFRTLHDRAPHQRSLETMPVFAAVSVEGEDDEEPIRPDLARMARASDARRAEAPQAPSTGEQNRMHSSGMTASDARRAEAPRAPSTGELTRMHSSGMPASDARRAEGPQAPSTGELNRMHSSGMTASDARRAEGPEAPSIVEPDRMHATAPVADAQRAEEPGHAAPRRREGRE